MLTFALQMMGTDDWSAVFDLKQALGGKRARLVQEGELKIACVSTNGVSVTITLEGKGKPVHRGHVCLRCEQDHEGVLYALYSLCSHVLTRSHSVHVFQHSTMCCVCRHSSQYRYHTQQG